jgi:hypothetical protein
VEVTTAEAKEAALKGDAAIGQLRSTLSNTVNLVQQTNAWLSFNSGAKESSLAYLQGVAPKAINTLEAVLRTRVLTGDAAYPMSRWVNDANELGRTITSFGKDVSGWSSWGIISATAAATGTQIGEGAAAAVSAATPVLGFAAVGLIAIAVIVVMK